MFFDGALNVENSNTVVIKWKDQMHTINFPENPMEN
jgi:hypothetical protein